LFLVQCDVGGGVMRFIGECCYVELCSAPEHETVRDEMRRLKLLYNFLIIIMLTLKS
jgi:hypothetical protein